MSDVPETTTSTSPAPAPLKPTNSVLDLSPEQYAEARRRLTGVDGTHLDHLDRNIRRTK
jgi:hypothetical protein